MTEDLLIKYIVGEASDAERRETESWIAADTANRKTYEHYYAIWQNSKMPGPAGDPDVDAAWQRFKEKRNSGKVPERIALQPKPNWRRISRVAALLIIVLSAGLLYWQQPVERRTYAATETFTLPDQSVITLNNQSGLSYMRSFNKKDRVLELKGEGFFDVKKNPEKPFIVHVQDIDITVLGTSFNVRSTSQVTEIVVETGVVKVLRAGNTYILRPKDKLTFRGDATKAELAKAENELYQYYRTNMFVCDRTPLVQLVEALSAAYDVPITIVNPVLEQQHLSSKYPRTDSVSSILEKVALTLNAKVEKADKGYILK